MRLPDVEAAVYKAAAEKNRAEPPRRYLGASQIGKPCERALWLSLRHEGQPVDGRICRLFQTGHDHEDRIIQELIDSGFEVWGSQEREQIDFEEGSFSGAVDGFIRLMPSSRTESGSSKLGLEIKTHNDKSFKDLVKKGVQDSKPVHYSQMQALGMLFCLNGFLYVAENKNDSSIYIEQISIKPYLGMELKDKAERIINSEMAPPMISTDPAYYICKWCDYNHVCRGE